MLTILKGAVTALMAALAPGVAGIQPWAGPCPVQPLSDSRMAYDSLKTAAFRRDTPYSLDSLLFETTRAQTDYQDVKSVLRASISQYGVRDVAKALMFIIEGGFYDTAPYNRGRAAVAYAFVHSLHPDSVSAEPIPYMMIRRAYPDVLRAYIANGSQYLVAGSREIIEALEWNLCEAIYHLRPFLTEAEVLERDVGELPIWFVSAHLLLVESVWALVKRSDGASVLRRYIAKEQNPVLRNELKKIAMEAAASHEREYW